MTTLIPSSSWTPEQLKADRVRVNENMKQSNQRFKDQVLPTLMNSGVFSGYTCCETAPLGSREKDLDRKYGIDFILHKKDGANVSCMIRMTVKDNFTIRTAARGFSESEFQKRIRQWTNEELSRNVVYIHGVQTYDKEDTTHFYVVNAYELYTAVQANAVEYEKHKNAQDGSEYISVKPQAAVAAGIKVKKVEIK